MGQAQGVPITPPSPCSSELPHRQSQSGAKALREGAPRGGPACPAQYTGLTLQIWVGVGLTGAGNSKEEAQR